MGSVKPPHPPPSHWSDVTWDWSDVTRFFPDSFKIHLSDQLPFSSDGILKFYLFSHQSRLLLPWSIISAMVRFGMPTVETTVSARIVRFFSCSWGDIVTVTASPGHSCASLVWSNIAGGILIFFDFPATITFFPRVGMLALNCFPHIPWVASNKEYWANHSHPTYNYYMKAVSILVWTNSFADLSSVCFGIAE